MKFWKLSKRACSIFMQSNIEEGLELLSGIPAGKAGEDGAYPEGSVFGRVDRKLSEYNEGLSRADGGRRGSGT